MKRIYVILMLAASTTLFAVGGCKKNNTDTETDLTSDVTVQSDDHAMFSAEDDAVSDDVNGALESNTLLSGKTAADTCGVTVSYDSTTIKRVVTLNYHGTNCSGTRSRNGVVKISILKNLRWRNAGAYVEVEIDSLKITRLSDNKSLVLNGTKKITNFSGHLLWELATSGVSSIVHTVTSSNMSATFDNGTSRLWQIAKKRTFTYDNGFVISVTGTSGTTGDVAVWGTNRLGQDFSTRITAPMVVKQSCNFRLVSGQIEHTKLLRPITVTFGLDASGNAVSSCPTGAYYFKAEWTSLLGAAHSVIRPY